MYTTAPDVNVNVTVGEVVVQTTATPTTSTTGTPTAVSTATPVATPISLKRYIENSLSIYGYGPVNSDVTLVGIGVSERTTTNLDGYFIFNPIYSYTFIYPELCLQAKDNEDRTTSMSCIPGLIKTNRIPLTVGPVYLSPTVSISENWKVLGDSSYLEGVTSPNTEVNVYIAKSYFIPLLQTRSDKDGNFSISLPTSDVANYKIFVASRFGDNLSAKSNTLTFVVTSKEQSFLNWLLSVILKYKLLVVITLEVLTVIILIIKLLKLSRRRKKRHTERDYLKYIKTQRKDG